eukprot:951618-Pelagomonas_calceolata.AAC.1
MTTRGAKATYSRGLSLPVPQDERGGPCQRAGVKRLHCVQWHWKMDRNYTQASQGKCDGPSQEASVCKIAHKANCNTMDSGGLGHAHGVYNCAKDGKQAPRRSNFIVSITDAVQSRQRLAALPRGPI